MPKEVLKSMGNNKQQTALATISGGMPTFLTKRHSSLNKPLTAEC
jgi:hypothetical protein